MLSYQWEDVVRFWNSKKGEYRERVGTSSRQKQKFTHRAGSRSFTSVAEAEEKLKEKKTKYEVIASTDSSVNLENIDNKIITKVLGPERYSRFDFKDLVLPRPNILDPAPSNTCLPEVKLKLKIRGKETR
ncbi:Polyribonucleotide nucleotidyltransferase [Gossypium arboreum]|uniref:Polyribonucleotide nucleotidyltransferase n=1 Tax=Gossypium arboreum TaxID=29729 RepID=A0A0B0NHG0_GOSAR|nr:Polyribonucleotide nucleotidyltransferase [Gossypium arboreum]